MRLYKKLPINSYKQLNRFPVYVETLYEGMVPFKIVGVRENEIEVSTQLPNGDVITQWVNQDNVFVVSTVCEQELNVNGCQVHNVNCCGGGKTITEHTNYFENFAYQRF